MLRLFPQRCCLRRFSLLNKLHNYSGCKNRLAQPAWSISYNSKYFCTKKDSFEPPAPLPSISKPQGHLDEVDLSQLKGSKYSKEGMYAIIYTCGVCEKKQGRTFSKDAYTKGVVILRCEGCLNFHLIADNLGWFEDEAVNIEDIMNREDKQIQRVITDEVIQFIKEENEINSKSSDSAE